MGGKDHDRLAAAAFIMGMADANGDPLPDAVLNHHDWRTFLLAKDMEPAGTYTGPDWVPFALWEVRDKPTGRVLVESPGAQDLWSAIERAVDEPNGVAVTLPIEIAYAQEQWGLTSKRTPAAHRRHYLELKARAESLAREIDRIESLEALTTGERFDFMKLFGDDEKNIVHRNVRLHNLLLRNTGAREVEGRKLGYKVGDLAGGTSPVNWEEYTAPENPDEPESPLNLSTASREGMETWRLLLGDDEDWPGIVPSVSDMLRRLSRHFDAEANNPAMQRPTFENAGRNFVTLHLCRYFHDSYGRVFPSIISRIICMFYRQGITDNEVSQMARKVNGAHSLRPT